MSDYGSDVGVRQQFEYTEIEPPLHWNDREHLLDTLNKMGQDGWQLVPSQAPDVSLVFMREITPEMQEARKALVVNEMQQSYRMHCHLVHDLDVYIGDAIEIHRERHPDCEFGLIWETS